MSTLWDTINEYKRQIEERRRAKYEARIEAFKLESETQLNSEIDSIVTSIDSEIDGDDGELYSWNFLLTAPANVGMDTTLENLQIPQQLVVKFQYENISFSPSSSVVAILSSGVKWRIVDSQNDNIFILTKTGNNLYIKNKLTNTKKTVLKASIAAWATSEYQR